MDTFMHVLAGVGVLALVLVAAVAIGILVVVIKVRGALKALSAATAGASKTPNRIHLSRISGHAWKDPEKVAQKTKEAIDLGFTDLGAFSVDEMPGVVLNAFVKPSESSYCIIYEHSVVNMWYDFVTKYTDGSGLTVSNAPRGGELDKRPGQKKINEKEFDLPQLYQRLVAERENKELLKLDGSPEEFMRVFETAYAEDMDWRNSRGGPTADEIRRVAKVSGMSVSDEAVKLVEEIKHRQALEGLVEAFEEQLKEKNHYTEEDWQGIRPRLMFVHEQLPIDMMKELISEHVPEEVVPECPSKADSIRQLFVKLNDQLPSDKRFERLTSLQAPVEADVYLSP